MYGMLCVCVCGTHFILTSLLEQQTNNRELSLRARYFMGPKRPWEIGKLTTKRQLNASFV